MLNFCANNYLGLSANDTLIEAAKKTLDSHGLGCSSVRFICGTQDVHKKLESKISEFHKMDDTILYPSCFDANAGLFEALLGPEDAVISDSLNHASLIDGIRLCKAKRLRYNHLDMADLENKLKEAQSSRLSLSNLSNQSHFAHPGFRMIVTDGVFSMDGHIAPLPKICDLAERYNAMVMIDECHATGFFGPTGRGTAEFFNCESRIDIINSTLGKALGGASGGYTSSSREIVTMLRQKSRPYLFSNTLSPPLAGATLACFDLIMNDTTLRDRLEANTKLFRSQMEKHGFDLGGSHSHPIVPIMLYGLAILWCLRCVLLTPSYFFTDAKIAGQFAERMLSKGIYVVGFSYPVVPHGQARIRTQISAAHTTQDVERCVQAFVDTRNELGITAKPSAKL